MVSAFGAEPLGARWSRDSDSPRKGRRDASAVYGRECLRVGSRGTRQRRARSEGRPANCLDWIKAGRAAHDDWLFRAVRTNLSPDEQEELASALELLKHLVDS